MFRSSISVKYGVLCKDMNKNSVKLHNLMICDHEILTYFRRELRSASQTMSARLDDLCLHFCLNPMVVHRKAYFSMFS